MSRLNARKWVGVVLWLVALLFPIADTSAGVTLNYFYDMDDGASSPPPGWTQGGTGSAGRASKKLEATVGSIFYTRDVTPGVAFSIEAVVHADNVGHVADRGTHLWLAIADDPLLFEHRLIEARLEEVAGGISKVVLRDGYDPPTPKGEVDLDWRADDPAVRVRLKRQSIGGTDYIVLQGEVSKTGLSEAPANWDDRNDPNPEPDTATSIKVSVSDFVPQAGFLNQVGFGNAVAGDYDSYWEYIHLTVADDATSVLPYWPPEPPAPTVTLTTAEPPHEVFSQVDLPIGAYLVNDVATLVLDTVSGELSSAPILDPSAPPAQHTETFTGLDSNQTVIGRVEVTVMYLVARAAAPLPVSTSQFQGARSYRSRRLNLILAMSLLETRRRRLLQSRT